MSKTDKDISELISSLLEEPKVISDNKVHKIVKPENLIENKAKKDKNINSIINNLKAGGTVINGDNNTIKTIIQDTYKRDDSAIAVNRSIIGYRNLNDKIEPENMTRKEYIHYLCYKYNFAVGKGWDGIERRHHRANWTKDDSHNITSFEEALVFMGIKKNNQAPDGIEKRKKERRVQQKDIRKVKTERRVISSKGRRKEDLVNNVTYFIVISTLLVIIISWISYSVLLYIEGLI